LARAGAWQAGARCGFAVESAVAAGTAVKASASTLSVAVARGLIAVSIDMPCGDV